MNLTATCSPRALFRYSYLHEVVQKAMDVHSTTDQAKSNPLLAAYQVCHDLCCSMMLGILHAQAQKLATRIGGLWANQLKVTFDKDKEVSCKLFVPKRGCFASCFCTPPRTWGISDCTWGIQVFLLHACPSLPLPVGARFVHLAKRIFYWPGGNGSRCWSGGHSCRR